MLGVRFESTEIKDFESNPLSPQPRKLTNRQTLVTNKALHMLINCQRFSKIGTNNNLEYSKLKASTVTLNNKLQSIKPHCINYAFQKMQDILSWKISEIDVYYCDGDVV